MSQILEVHKDYLHALHSDIKSALARLDALLADVGCLHINKIGVTTMDGTNLRKYVCPDCSETLEEEIDVSQVL